MQKIRTLEIDSGTLEAIKWLAVILMTVDHINTFLLGGRYPVMFDVGRVAFPLFGFAFAYNMARPAFFDRFPGRLAKLVAVGCVAQVSMVAMGVPIAHLNIMFTMAFAAVAVYLATGLPRVAGAAVVVCTLALPGMVVDYGALGLLYVLAAYYLVRRPSIGSWAAFGLAMALLYGMNGNFFGVVALPIIGAALLVRVPCRRSKQAFYAYYPVHLALLASLANLVLVRA